MKRVERSWERGGEKERERGRRGENIVKGKRDRCNFFICIVMCTFSEHRGNNII